MLNVKTWKQVSAELNKPVAAQHWKRSTGGGATVGETRAIPPPGSYGDYLRTQNNAYWSEKNGLNSDGSRPWWSDNVHTQKAGALLLMIVDIATYADGEGEVAGASEFFYRAMSHAEYGKLVANRGLTKLGGHELMVSTVQAYSEKALAWPGYDILVKFETQPGTLNYLSQFGVKHSEAVGDFGFGHLPDVRKGWMKRGNLLFKAEEITEGGSKALNVGLGYNPAEFNRIIKLAPIP